MASESVGKTFTIWQTSNLYFLHTVREIMGLLYLRFFAFCWERCPLRPLSSLLYILSPLQASKPLCTVAGFPLMRQAGESFMWSPPEPMVCGWKGDWLVELSIHPILVGGDGGTVFLRTRGLVFLPQRLWRALQSHGLCVGPVCPTWHPYPHNCGMFSELSCSSLCQDPELLHVFLFRDRAGELALGNASEGGVVGERITEHRVVREVPVVSSVLLTGAQSWPWAWVCQVHDVESECPLYKS